MNRSILGGLLTMVVVLTLRTTVWAAFVGGWAWDVPFNNTILGFAGWPAYAAGALALLALGTIWWRMGHGPALYTLTGIIVGVALATKPIESMTTMGFAGALL
jgi:hypothetical protein